MTLERNGFGVQNEKETKLFSEAVTLTGKCIKLDHFSSLNIIFRVRKIQLIRNFGYWWMFNVRYNRIDEHVIHNTGGTMRPKPIS